MRPAASFLVFVLACSSSSARSPDAGVTDDSGGGVTIDGGNALSCGTALDSYCMAHPTDCPRTLAGAKLDQRLCPASLTACTGYDVINHTALDTGTQYFFAQGQLVAIAHRVLPGPSSCLAGPATFAPPACSQQAEPLPACTH